MGNSSYITDINGEVMQHVEYFPFGETFLEEHSNTDRTPYLFNGKELDEETGLYYYGARYYDPVTSVWQSVDPLAEEFPGWSPYNFGFDNPIKFIDPDGRAPDTDVDKEGVVLRHDADSQDKFIYQVSDKGSRFIVGAENPDHDYQVGEKLNLANKKYNSWGVADGAIEPDYTLESIFMPMPKLLGALGKYFKLGKAGATAAKGAGAAAKGGVEAIKAGKYTITKTVANNLATRPYINSPSTITNIMKSGKGIPDQFFKGGMNYKVPGTFNGSKGIYELGINPETNTIYHFLFKTVK